MGLSNCCCVTGTCSRTTSLGVAVMPVWKNDSTGQPVAGRPFCTFYRTLTITIQDDTGPVYAVAVVRSKFEHGASPLTNVSAQLVLESLTGAKPSCSPFTVGSITSRQATGYTRYYDCNGVRQGTINYNLSEPITLIEIENTARMLSALVDWPNVGEGAHQEVKYQNGSIVTNPVNFVGCGLLNESISGLFTGGGISSAINYVTHAQPPEFGPTGPLSGLWPSSTSVAGLLPTLKLHAYAWRSRIRSIAGWRRHNYVENRAPAVAPCFYKNSNTAVGFSACSEASVEAPSITGGTIFEDPPAGPDASTFITC